MGWIGIAIIVLLVITAVLEFVGIARKDAEEVDTITEVFRLVRDNLPKPLAYMWTFLILGLLAWTIPHFLDLV